MAEIEKNEEPKKTVWEKVKDFFKKPVVNIIAWIVFVLSVVCLFIGGEDASTMNKAITLAIALIGALTALINFILKRK